MFSDFHFPVYYRLYYFLFDLILYIPVNNFSVMSGWVFPDWTSTKQGYVLLKDTTQWRRWGSNPQPLDLGSSTLLLRLNYFTWCSVYRENYRSCFFFFIPVRVISSIKNSHQKFAAYNICTFWCFFGQTIIGMKYHTLFLSETGKIAHLQNKICRLLQNKIFCLLQIKIC